MLIDVEKHVVDDIISDYEKSIVDKLINGEEVTIPGLGVLVPAVRKVKNDKGRNYSIRIKVNQCRSFYDSIVKSYEENKSKFIKEKQ